MLGLPPAFVLSQDQALRYQMDLVIAGIGCYTFTRSEYIKDDVEVNVKLWMWDVV